MAIGRRDDGGEVWRGKPYLEMSEYTPMMERHGFLHYPGEFWHYNKGDALYHLMTKSGQVSGYGPVHWIHRRAR